ncbi:MAG: hypothetical protein KC620_25465, partial [Myxococcales bacterium]|nr:hypothetical protein [Myxococcales bacterium]
RAYEAMARPAELTGVLERHAAVLGDRAERAILLLRRAHIAYHQLDDEDTAVKAYERVLTDPAAAVETTVAAVDALADLRPRRVDLDRLRRLLTDRIEQTGDARARAGLLAARGTLWLTRLGHVGNARIDLEEAVSLDADHGPAHLALGQMAIDRADAAAAAVHFERALFADDPADRLTGPRVETAFEGLQRALDKLGRGDEVAMLAEDVLARHPGCRAARAVSGDESDGA